MYMYNVQLCLYPPPPLSVSGDLPLEELLALYNLQRRSGTPDTEVESSSRVETSLSEHWMSSLDHERTALTC